MPIGRYEPPSSNQLLRHILERPELVAAVRTLNSEVLGRLIDRVGLEDAGEIVALASMEQLSEVFDQDLWRAEAAGADEELDLARFGLWLEVLAEAGDEFLARRLRGLPREFLQLVLHRTVLVLDLDALAVTIAQMGGEDAEWAEKALEGTGHFEEWEEFRLIVRAPGHWDVLWCGLLALDQDHHALLRELMERCAALDSEFINGNGGLYEVLTSAELLENDLQAERQDRRAKKGHVSPADARAFLAWAARGVELGQRDPITRAYFRELDSSTVVPNPLSSGHSGSGAVEELVRLVRDTKPRAASEVAPQVAPPERRGGRSQAAQLTARQAGSQPEPMLQRTLAELRERDPACAAQRTEELAFLANVWTAGGVQDGRRPRPVEALEYVAAICSRALAGALRPHERAVDVLARTPADLLFRNGYAAAQAWLMDTPPSTSMAVPVWKLDAGDAR